MRPVRRLLVISLVLMLLNVTACGTVAGINQTGVVLALGVDPGPSGQLLWTFMFPNPTITPSSEASVKPSEEFYTLQSYASSLVQAAEKVSMLTDRHVYLGDIQVVALSSHISSRELVHVIHLLINTGDFPPRAWLTIASPSGEAVLKVSPPEEVVPTVFLGSYFSCRICHAIQLETRVWQVWDDLLVPSHTAVIPWSTVQGHTIQVNGSIWLTPTHIVKCGRKQTLYWAMAMGKYRAGTLAIDNNRVVAEGVRIASHRWILASSRHVVARWIITLHGHWQSENTGFKETSYDNLAEKMVLRHVLEIYQLAAKQRVDPFGVLNQVVWTTSGKAIMPQTEVTVLCHIEATARTE